MDADTDQLFKNLCGRLGELEEWDLQRSVAEVAVGAGIWKHASQRPGNYYPSLSAKPIHDPKDYWFTALLEENAPAIIEEVLRVTGEGEKGFNTVEETSIYKGDWKQIRLYDHGQAVPAALQALPVTTGVIAKIPEAAQMTGGSAVISRLAPGTHVTPHCGPTNARLRLHMGIKVPEGVSIRIDEEWVKWQEGKCLIFDDSFEHEVKHTGTEPRIVLIMDFWHPDMTEEQRRTFVGGRSRAAKEKRIRDFLAQYGLTKVQKNPDGTIGFVHHRELNDMVRQRLDGVGISAIEIGPDDRLIFRR